MAVSVASLFASQLLGGAPAAGGALPAPTAQTSATGDVAQGDQAFGDFVFTSRGTSSGAAGISPLFVLGGAALLVLVLLLRR